MKKTSAFIRVNLWLIFLCFSVAAQDFRTVRDGIEYAEMTRQIDNAPVKMNLLRLDLSKVRLGVVHAMDTAIGLEKTSSIAMRHGAFAAINGGFFRIDKSIFEGDAAGILQIDGKLLSESGSNRTALIVSNDLVPIDISSLNFTKGQNYFTQINETQIRFEHLESEIKLSINKQIFDISGINRERKSEEIIVYTPEFNKTTLTDQNGLEVIVVNGKIKEILEGKGSTEIPSNGFIVSASGAKREELYKKVKLKNKASVENNIFYYPTINGEKSKFKSTVQAEDITNGVPQLIKDGKIEITWQEEKSSKEFVDTKHPRTAVAKLKDGKFLMVTVDGRSEASGGIGLQNLAAILLELGAIDAMNLDGGGSTTMFLDGKVVNKPSDKEGERKVGDAILVTPRK